MVAKVVMKMMVKVRALVCLLAVFLPLVVKGGGPEPFSVSLWVDSRQYGSTVDEPYVEVAVYSTQSPDSPLFEGFTNGDGDLRLGLFAGLPQPFYVEVKRERVDGAFQRTLPLVVSDPVEVESREELWCVAHYDWDSGVNEVHCYGWSLFAETAPTERE